MGNSHSSVDVIDDMLEKLELPLSSREALKKAENILKSDPVIANCLFKEFSKKNNSMFVQQLTLENLEEFSWQNLLKESDENFPVTLALFRSRFPKTNIIANRTTKGPKHHKRSMTDEEASEVLDVRIGLLLSIILFTRSPKKTKFIQTCIGVEIWRQTCSHKIFKTLIFFGISEGVEAARSHVDQLGLHHNIVIHQWREAVETSTRMDVDSPTVSSEGASEVKGYSVTWDNVQINTHAKHCPEDGGNKFLLWCMCFGTEKRVSTCHYSDTTVMRARDLSPCCYLPSPADF